MPLTKYWLNRNISHLWEINTGPLTPIAQTEMVYLAADVDALLRQREEALEVAEIALLRNGYRKECSIAACNCGAQWGHGGHANERLREIDDALPYENGKTIIKRVEEVVTQLAASTARCAELEDWIRFLRDDDNDSGLYATNGESCVDFYRNCDLALEGKPVPILTTTPTERPPA